MGLKPRERILTLRLMEKLEKYPACAGALGVEAVIVLRAKGRKEKESAKGGNENV